MLTEIMAKREQERIEELKKKEMLKKQKELNKLQKSQQVELTEQQKKERYENIIAIHEKVKHVKETYNSMTHINLTTTHIKMLTEFNNSKIILNINASPDNMEEIYTLNESVQPLYEMVSKMAMNKVVRGNNYNEYMEMLDESIAYMYKILNIFTVLYDANEDIVRCLYRYVDNPSYITYSNIQQEIERQENTKINKFKNRKQFTNIVNQRNYLFTDIKHSRLFSKINEFMYIYTSISLTKLKFKYEQDKKVYTLPFKVKNEETNKVTIQNRNIKQIYTEKIIDTVNMIYNETYSNFIYDIRKQFERKPKHFDKLMYCSYVVFNQFEVINDSSTTKIFLNLLDELGVDYLNLYRENTTTGLMELRTKVK